jgi:hypothetical protein
MAQLSRAHNHTELFVAALLRFERAQLPPWHGSSQPCTVPVRVEVTLSGFGRLMFFGHWMPFRERPLDERVCVAVR